ncbi:IS6 family transposase [Sulfitobacter dubius]|uniref:IS6 family transposase n=1 Tax=Sulfitobacter dubius TaxID=218673 RepID=UPI0022AE7107|nr:IS6 family transposase [Sulfitobacter dubius]MCZ4368729.1 IS6 family transposase [Sulfitobacter dubius]
MISQTSQPRLKGYRFPRSIVSYAVWAYHRFALSLRDVEDLLAERGVTVIYETIRAWVGKFGAQIAKRVRAARRQPTDKWHLDEVVITIRGKKHWLWRAVDSNGEILDILVQTRRNARAAKRFISRLIARWGMPRVIITDKLRSYSAALRKLGLAVDHRAHKGLNNRIEGSHRPTRKREKIQGRFKSARQAQRFLAVHDETANLFRPRRHTMTATTFRQKRADAFCEWAGCASEIAA